MRNPFQILLVVVAVLLVGCASQGPSSSRSTRGWDPDAPVYPIRERSGPSDHRSQVVLLADADGTVGMVAVAGATGASTLNRAGQAVAFENLDETYEVSTAEIEGVFQEPLDAEPQAPIEFVVHFPTGSSEHLIPASMRVWEGFLDVLAGRRIPEITISGHADRERSEEYNMDISRRRAQATRDWIVGAGVNPDWVETAWYGESRPAVPTADGVAEQANRRVTIRVR